MKRTLSKILFNRAALVLTATLALAFISACQQRGASSNGANANANSSDSSAANASAPSGYIDLVGKWEGQAGGHPSTLVITSHMGETFSGTETVGEFQLRIAGVVDLKTRQITIRETDVIKGQGSYPLGVGTGVVAPNSRQITGEWKAKGSASTFSFTK
jgi:hypothetical protein